MTGRSSRTIRPSQCTVCAHQERARIELLRAGGASLRILAEKFGISKDAVHRHFENHVTDARKAELCAGPARVEELANKAADESKSLLDYLSITRSVLFNQLLNAAEAGDRLGVASIAGRLIEALREVGRVTGELRTLSGITINNSLTLVTSPEFMRLQEGLLQVCKEVPAARQPILQLLRGLDSPPAEIAKPNGSAWILEGEVLRVGA